MNSFDPISRGARGETPARPETSFPRLTHFQLAALVAIATHIERHGSGPILRELAEQLGLGSKGHARYYVIQLADAGLVTFERVGRAQQIAARTIRPTEQGRRVVEQWKALCDSALLRGKYILSLNPSDVDAARRAGLPFQALPTITQNERTLVLFEDRAERNFWATLILQDSQPVK